MKVTTLTRGAVWYLSMCAVLVVMGGCGREAVKTYALPGHEISGHEKMLILPFLDVRTFCSPNDPHKEDLHLKARSIFVEAIKSNPVFRNNQLLTPDITRPKESITIAQALKYGRDYGADLVVVGQIFSFTGTRAASIPPRSGMFIRIFSVPEGRLIFVGDHYRAAGVPGASGGRERQARVVADAILLSYSGILKTGGNQAANPPVVGPAEEKEPAAEKEPRKRDDKPEAEEEKGDDKEDETANEAEDAGKEPATEEKTETAEEKKELTEKPADDAEENHGDNDEEEEDDDDDEEETPEKAEAKPAGKNTEELKEVVEAVDETADTHADDPADATEYQLPQVVSATVLKEPGEDAPTIMMLPYHERKNPVNLIEHHGGGAVVTSLYSIKLAFTGKLRVLFPPLGKADHGKLLTIEEALELAREMGADYVVRGQVVEFRRSQSVPSFYSVIISTALLAAQVLFAEQSGVDIATEVFKTEDGSCIYTNRDIAHQKYVVQTEMTVRRIVSYVGDEITEAIFRSSPRKVEPIIDAIVPPKPRYRPRGKVSGNSVGRRNVGMGSSD